MFYDNLIPWSCERSRLLRSTCLFFVCEEVLEVPAPTHQLGKRRANKQVY